MEIVWQKEVSREANDYLIKDLYCVLAVMGRYVVASFSRYAGWYVNDLTTNFTRGFNTEQEAIEFAEAMVKED